METQTEYGVPGGMTQPASWADPVVKLSMVAGIMTAIGYLFWLFLAIVKREDMAPVAPVISIAVIGMLAGFAVITCARLFQGMLRAYLVAGLGILLQILVLVFAAKIAGRIPYMSCGLDYVVGNQALSALGLVLLLMALGALDARQKNAASPVIRCALGGVAAATLMLYLVQILVFAAGDESDALPIASAFERGAAPIAYAVLLTLGLLGVLGISIGAAAASREVDQVAKAGLIVARIVLGLIIAFPFFEFIMAAAAGDDLKSRVVPLIGGIAAMAPLVGAFYILVAGISESLTATAALLAAPRRPVLQPLPAVAVAGPVLYPLPSEQIPQPTDGIEGQLRKLKSWREQGLITEEEYQQKRSDLLKRL